MHIMGKTIRKELKLIPAEVKVVEHVSYTYLCRECEKNSEETPIIKTTPVEPIVKGSQDELNYYVLIPFMQFYLDSFQPVFL